MSSPHPPSGDPASPDHEQSQPYSAVQDGSGQGDDRPDQTTPAGYGQQPPAYGQEPPAYGQQPPAYGQQPPAYGQQQPPPPPAFGQQPPPAAYGQQPPPYGEQQLPAYGQPAYGEQPWTGVPQAQPWDNSAYGVPVAGALPKEAYASWGQRVGAYLIDYGVFIVLSIIAVIILAVGAARSSSSFDPATTTTAADVDPLLWVGYGLLFLIGIVQLIFTIWNRWIRAGRTGMSIGKERMGIKLVGVESGTPIGGGKAFLRDFVRGLLGYVPIVPLIDLLFPLWDDKRQTLTDKIMSTVVVKNQ